MGRSCGVTEADTCVNAASPAKPRIKTITRILECIGKGEEPLDRVFMTGQDADERTGANAISTQIVVEKLPWPDRPADVPAHLREYMVKIVSRPGRPATTSMRKTLLAFRRGKQNRQRAQTRLSQQRLKRDGVTPELETSPAEGSESLLQVSGLTL